MIRAAALMGLAAIGLIYPQASPPVQEDKRPHVETAHPQRKTIYRRLSVPGEVLPNQQVAVHARVQGYLEKMFVDRGSWIKAGDPLFKIAVPELEKQLEKEKAELAVCGPSVAREEASLAWREAIHKRMQQVGRRSPDLVNAEGVDDAKGRYEVAKAELDLTRAKEAAIRAEIERIQALLSFASYSAPFEGVVTERWADPGELIQPGTTKLLHIMQVSPVRVRVHVPAPDVRFVRADSLASLAFDELPGKSFQAKVARLFWALKTTTKTMAVEIDLPNDDRSVRPGMFARVSMELDARENALVLPAAALVSEKKKTFVFVVRDGVAKKIPIKLGADTGIEFEAAEGLSDRDEVIVSGKNMVSDGDKVRAKQQ